jgi:hypothetical protein
MADKIPSDGRLATRATNAGQRPGLAHHTFRKRRTKEEIARDKALEDEQKHQKKNQRTKSVARIAELEDRMAIDDASAENAHPRNQKSLLSYAILVLLGY